MFYFNVRKQTLRYLKDWRVSIHKSTFNTGLNLVWSSSHGLKTKHFQSDTLLSLKYWISPVFRSWISTIRSDIGILGGLHTALWCKMKYRIGPTFMSSLSIFLESLQYFSLVHLDFNLITAVEISFFTDLWLVLLNVLFHSNFYIFLVSQFSAKSSSISFFSIKMTFDQFLSI